MSGNERLEQALKLLLDDLFERAERHPWGHLLPGRGECVDLRFSLPLSWDDEAIALSAERLDHALSGALDSILAHRASFRPGRVFCLRCRRADCQHGAPADAREVFAGYSPTGVPRFVDLGQWLLERQDPRVALLYSRDDCLITAVADEQQLTEALLPAFRDQSGGFRLHGQVVAGWYRVPSLSGRSESLAVTFQILSSRASGRGRRRYGLNVIGTGPGSESLSALHHRVGDIPWAPAVRWGQSVLDSIERAGSGRRSSPEKKLARRVDGLVSGLARRLEQRTRAAQRRTRHAERRHIEGDRPTRMAVSDLGNADTARFFFDARRNTLVVLGERGRTHFFNENGKLVTSVRYPPAAIEKRIRVGQWQPATESQLASLRARLRTY